MPASPVRIADKREEPTMLAGRPAIQTGGDRRRYKRVRLLHSAALRDGGRLIDCVIRDISTGGARLLIEERVAKQQELVLDIDGVGRLNSRVVWQSADQAGIRFLDEPVTVKSQLDAAWGPDTAAG